MNIFMLVSYLCGPSCVGTGVTCKVKVFRTVGGTIANTSYQRLCILKETGGLGLDVWIGAFTRRDKLVDRACKGKLGHVALMCK